MPIGAYKDVFTARFELNTILYLYPINKFLINKIILGIQFFQ
jgi:hypothetical protein